MSETSGAGEAVVPTITRVVVRNYRSIAACDVTFGPLTFLVGENGVGKSNFLDALRFVGEALQSPLEQVITRRGGIDRLVRRDPQPAPEFSIDLEFALPDGLTGSYGFTIARRKSGAFALDDERFGLESAEMELPKLPAGEIIAALPKLPGRLSLPLASGRPELRPMFETLSRLAFYRPNLDLIRQTQPLSSGEVLSPDGANLAAVVRRLASEDVETLARIEQYLRAIVPMIQDFSVITAGIAGETGELSSGLQTLAFRHRVPGRPTLLGEPTGLGFVAADESDGTLRAAAILTALLQTGPESPVFVGIEEPEMALHPGALGVLIDAMREATVQRQVLVTTHSADVLDHPSVRADEFRTVTMVDGATVIGPADEVARDMLRRHLFSAGELLRMHQLNAAPGSL